jgi:site-specific recombinase XerD
MADKKPQNQVITQDAQRIEAAPIATRATTDYQLLDTWIAEMGSEATRKNFERTVSQFLGALPMGLREAKLEDVREAIESITAGRADSTAKQYALRVKSFIGFAHRLGYLQFNAGAAIKVKVGRRSVAKRLPSETEIALLVRAATTKRDRILLQVAYAGGLRVSEIVSLTWSDVIERDGDQVQLSVTGKGGHVRDVLLPEVVSRNLMALRGDAHSDAPLFKSRKGGKPMGARAVNYMIKAAAAKAEVNPDISAHWIRHGHASHALDRGATLADVKETLGHANVATTSTYLHSRPDRSSGLKLDAGVWL